MTTNDPITCPKCGNTSGDNWAQCDGDCPMPMSPHYESDRWPTHRAKAKALAARSYDVKTTSQDGLFPLFSFEKEYPTKVHYVEEWWEERYLPRILAA